MMNNNKNLFIVTYYDNKNVKHTTFIKQFKSVKNLENQYGKITVEPVIHNISLSIVK